MIEKKLNFEINKSFNAYKNIITRLDSFKLNLFVLINRNNIDHIFIT